LYDRNSSGFLDYAELRNALRHYGLDVSDSFAASVVKAYDSNPDGKLDLEEFRRLVRDIEQRGRIHASSQAGLYPSPSYSSPYYAAAPASYYGYSSGGGLAVAPGYGYQRVVIPAVGGVAASGASVARHHRWSCSARAPGLRCAARSWSRSSPAQASPPRRSRR